MQKFKNESSFFDPTKKEKNKSSKKISSILKKIGGKKGLIISSAILDKPKYLL